MTIVLLELSDKRVVTLPNELARAAGLVAGEVEAVVSERGLLLVPAEPAAGYGAAWNALSAVLREQAVPFGISAVDRRDSEYWEAVGPLFDETERTLGAISP